VALSLSDAKRDEVVLWLPAGERAPQPSPHLLRAEPDEEGPAEASTATLSPFIVPVLLVPASPAIDTLLALADQASPELRSGDSVMAFAALAGLALEIVAGGRVLPGLIVGEGGQYMARWSPVWGGRDHERLRIVGESLPPLCRALGPGQRPVSPVTPFAGNDPRSLARDALEAFVDAACRDAIRQLPRSLVGLGTSRSLRKPPVVEAWLTALAEPQADVGADSDELAKLERLISEWRSGAAARTSDWRLCFRVREPDEDDASAEAGSMGGVPATEGVGTSVTARDQQSGDAAPGSWRVEFLLQAADDPSLVVGAEEVWRSGAALRRAARTLEMPHEVLLGELGRARLCYPQLSLALREAAPTALIIDLNGVYHFLTDAAPALEVAGFGVLLPTWWRNPSSRLGARLNVRTSSGRGVGQGLVDEAGIRNFDWQVALGDEVLSADELQALAALKAPLVRVRGKWLELRPGEAEKLAEFLRKGPGQRRATATMTVADLLRAAAGLDDAFGLPVTGVHADGLFGSLLSGDLENRIQVGATPAGFAGHLRPYQLRGVAWMALLERTGLGACLADDMGLGKTAMVLGLVLDGKKQGRRSTTGPGPTLVVCPTSVVGNWEREAKKFVPELKVVVHHGVRRAKEADFSKKMAGADLVITSYSLLDRDRPALESMQWSRMVLDEAQNIKNPEAKQTRAARSLRAPRRLALTGTPVENHLGDLWSIMEVLNPGLLGSASSFREHFALPIERYHEEDAAERLRTLTRPFVLRRLKTDRSIISDLPDKLEMKVLCNLTREQATLYRAVVDDMLRRIDEAEGIERRGLVLSTMLRLKQVCNHPAHYLGDGSTLAGRSGKLERTVEMLEEVVQVDERALVFTQFTEMGSMLRSYLQQRLGCQTVFLHGGVPRRQRDAMVERFQSGDGLRVMVLSLKAGGTGLNLTAANHVVHFDRWWNPAVENQATDRAFRIGQHRNVQVRTLICAGTLEDRIDQMIEAKRELAERIVGSGEAWLTELSTAELREVFRLSSAALGAA
jgi:SNF2-related domain/SNF2 Helicase protein/Helicase conserved C-terminal domain